MKILGVVLLVIAVGAGGFLFGNALGYESGENAGYNHGTQTQIAEQEFIKQQSYDEGYNAAYAEVRPALEEVITVMESYSYTPQKSSTFCDINPDYIGGYHAYCY